MRRQLIWALALVLATLGVATAQETTSGSLAGEVLDNQGAAVPGATVTITSGQGARTVVTDSNGRFFAPFLTPGSYSVKVELAGFSPVEQKNIAVRLGARYELNFTLKVGDIQEVVEVIGSAPVIDTNSTTAGGSLDSDTLKRLPVGRNFTQTLYLVPGVSDSSGVGNANPSIGGASGLENNYIVDGVNISNQGFGGVGVYSIVFGSLGTGVTTDFIKETQVKTAGFEAEYGQATGGVVNVVTKSGTNNFHGSLFSYFQPAGLEATRDTLHSPNGTSNDVSAENYDFGVTVGAPIIKDKLFFFGAFNPQYQTLTRTAPDNVLASGAPAFPLAALGEVDRKRRILSYAGKLTWQAGPNHRFDFSAFGDPSHGDVGPQRTTALLSQVASKFSELEFYGGYNESLRYDGIIKTNWLIEASASHASTNFKELPSVDEHEVSDRTVVPFRNVGGIGFYDTGAKGTNTQFALKSTNIFTAGGNHQLRYGVAFEDIDYARGFDRSGPDFTFPDGQLSSTGASVRIQSDPAFGVIYRVVRANYGPVINTNQKYLNWFAQDTWQIGKKLTIRPGIRWERQKLNGGQATDPNGNGLCFEGETLVGGIGQGLGPDGVAGTGDDGTDGGLAPTTCQFTWSNNWGPRIGATYDFTGTGKSKLYASWGRFFVKIPNDLAARALAADAGVSRIDYFDAGLTQPVPNGVVALGTTNHYVLAGVHAATFANGSKSTFSDEFVGGFEYEVARGVNMGVRYIHRNISTVLEDYAAATPVQYELGVPGTESVFYFIDNISPSLQTINPQAVGFPELQQAAFEDPVHTYDSIEVTANKTFSDNWSLFASYRYAKLEGNFEGFFRSDNGQSDPAITSLFDFPTNDPDYSAIGGPVFGYVGDIRFQGNTLGQGQLPNDRPHQLKLYANYTFSNLNLGLGFNAGSGRRLTALAANPIYANAGEIPLTLRGGGICGAGVAACPPAANLSQLDSTDKEILFDLHADYTFKFGDSQRLVFLADVFNLFNDQDPVNYDTYVQASVGVLNPNYGQPTNGGGSNVVGFQAPRALRLGARFEW